MNFECQKVDLEITGYRLRPTISICERVISTYEQLDRFIDILTEHKKFMRDGKPAEKDGLIINITL